MTCPIMKSESAVGPLNVMANFERSSVIEEFSCPMQYPERRGNIRPDGSLCTKSQPCDKMKSDGHIDWGRPYHFPCQTDAELVRCSTMSLETEGQITLGDEIRELLVSRVRNSPINLARTAFSS